MNPVLGPLRASHIEPQQTEQTEILSCGRAVLKAAGDTIPLRLFLYSSLELFLPIVV